MKSQQQSSLNDRWVNEWMNEEMNVWTNDWMYESNNQ